MVKVGLRPRLSPGPLHKPLQQARGGRVGRHPALALTARQKVTQLRLGEAGEDVAAISQKSADTGDRDGVVPHVNGWLGLAILPRLIGVDGF